MDDDKSRSPESLACPICRRPLRRTHGFMLTALECERCGPFSDFDGSSVRARGTGSVRTPGDSGSDPTS
jgi:hypothetical protein